MADTPNLGLPYLLAAQAQKHVTHNEAIRVLDCLVHLMVLDRDLSAPPGAPAEGARYIVAAGASGAWAGKSGKIAAYQDAAWMFYTPREGWLVWIADENVMLAHDGTAWISVSGGGGGGGVTDHGALTGLGDDDHPQYLNNARGDARYTPIAPATLGINATADSTNKLVVGSAASLFNHVGSGGHQIKINKAAASDTASVLYQTGFSGRAEFGTTGDDNFHVKVSPDGATWFEAITIDDATGRAVFPQSDFDVQVFTTPGTATWTKPLWANSNATVEVHMLGGGAGGGAGRRGAAATVRCGGGGGSSGSYATFKRRAADFGATESVVVGAGGNGGTAQATNDSNGANGSVGGNTSFATLRAFGGNFGSGGTATAGSAGAAFGIVSPFSLAALAGAAASTTGAAGVASVSPGASSATGISSGGGSGGGITTANASSGGGGSGQVLAAYQTTVAAGVAASAAGANGGAASNFLPLAYGVGFGTGGAGGGSSSTAAAGAGGAGLWGGGGGGGGASLNGFNSGGGGKGGDGWVVVVTYR
jgi:Protein of unknown function (DUF2793)